MNIKWNEYTWYSKLTAAVFFILILPVWTFYLGTQFQKTNDIFDAQTKQFEYTKNTSVKMPDTLTYAGEIQYKSSTFYRNGVSMPYIVDYPDKTVMDKVNEQLREVESNMGCDSSDGVHNYFDAKTRVAYNKNGVYSVSIHSSYYCGGPYPTNDSNDSMTFDMRTGAVVPFEKLFTNYTKDKVSVISSAYSKMVASSSDASRTDDLCPNTYTLSDIEGIATYSFSYVIEGNNIRLQPNFPHVSAACSVEVSIPVSGLARYFSTASILARIK